MVENGLDASLVTQVVRYGRQVVMRAMERTRYAMRGSHRFAMKATVLETSAHKAEENPTKGIDRDIEEDVIASLRKKFARIPGMPRYTIFSEEHGIVECGDRADAGRESELVVFVDPIDGTEFAESLQGGWCLLSFYETGSSRAIGAVAGDIFLDRLFWAPDELGRATGLDFITHSEFHLDGGSTESNKTTLDKARVNVLTTKPSRYMAMATQQKLMEALAEHDCRINLSWGSNTLIQVAAGYADAAVEFARGFATYDVLPGLVLCRAANVCVLDLNGREIDVDAVVDVNAVFEQYRRDPAHPCRLPFVAAATRPLAERLVSLISGF
jgi:myo-inositol-1(or 4)-monophosphatase